MTVLERINAELGELSKEVQKSLVRVSSGERGEGAGTIWHAEGLILTNAHVVLNDDIRVTLPDGVRKKATLLAMDRELDLAALAVEAWDLPTIDLGSSDSMQAGEWVIAFGHPWGVHGAATAGVFIGQGRTVQERPQWGREWLAVSLHYRPGHSGGPLVDVNGNLIGINTVMVGPDVGLAVPIHAVKRFLKENLNSI